MLKNFGMAAVFLSALSLLTPQAGIASVHVKAFDPRSVAYPWMSVSEYQTLKKKAVERGKRSVASSEQITDDLMSAELKSFRTKFLAIQNPNEIDPLLNQLDSDYSKSPDDLKLVAANLIPLRAFRSFVYRCTTIASTAKVTHAMLLAAVKEMASLQGIFLPTSQWRAGFQYVTEPMQAGDIQFKTMAEAQDYLSNTVYKELLKSADRISQLNFSEKSVIWDNQLLYGTASFVDSVDRYRMVGEAERNANLASIHASLHNIAMFRAYDYDRFFPMMQDLGKIWGVEAFFWDPVDGATAQKRISVIRKYPDNFKLTTDGKDWTSLAFKNLTQAVYYSNLSWNELKDQPASHTQIMDAGMFRPFSREIGLSLATLQDMIQGKKEIRSAVTGETTVVNFPAIYSNPPASLQIFLPTDFESGPEFLAKTFADESPVQYRNYLKGKASTWSVPAYKTYFPEISKSSDVSDAARILSQAWGGGLVAVPIAAFVQ